MRMTKLCRLGQAAIIASLVVLSSCRKEEPAPPPPPKESSTSQTNPGAGKRASRPDGAPMSPEELLAQRDQMMQAFRNLNKKEHRRRRTMTLTAEQQAKIDRVREEMASPNTTADKKIELLESINQLPSKDMLDVVSTALDDGEVDVRIAAMEQLEDLDDPAMLDVVAKGLRDKDEQVRAAAIETLYYVSDPQVQALLKQGLADPSEDVRLSALDMTAEQPTNDRYQIYTEALKTTYEDVFSEVISQLEDESNHSAFSILLLGLKHPDPAFREETNDAIDFLVSQTFSSYEEAMAWWEKNKQNYDEELFEKD